MQQQKSKKIFIYFFLFLIIGTLNNKNLNKANIPTINSITIEGLDEKNNIIFFFIYNYWNIKQ